jgi:chromosome segregation ATPase
MHEPPAIDSADGATGADACELNPFRLPEATDVYAEQEETERRKKDQWKLVKQMSLADRAMINAPALSRRAVRRRYEDQMTQDQSGMVDGIKPVCEIRQRQQHAACLVEEQREIFLANLLIERHDKEHARLQSQKQLKGQRLVKLEAEWKEARKNSRIATGQYEEIKLRSRRKFEIQKRRRTDIESEVRRKLQAMAGMESQILDIEEKFNRFKACDDLLKDIEMTHGRMPQTMAEFMEFFEELESDSLFILDNVADFHGKNEQSLGGLEAEEQRLQKQLADTKEQIAQARETLAVIRTATQPKVGVSEAVEANLARIQTAVGTVFIECYPQSDPSQGPLTMLSIIEMRLEEMTNMLRRIDPSFFVKKMKALNLQKRARQREANLEKKQADQTLKLAQMLERATRPVKPKQGRPITPRVVPMQVAKKDSEQQAREQHEKYRMDSLLYGPIFS